MPRRYFQDSLEELKRKTTMSQKLARVKREFTAYAGSDTELAQQIATLRVLKKHNALDIDEDDYNLIMDILIEMNKAMFSSSPKTSEITKLGFWTPEKRRKPVDASK